jgi:hypothetical protein
MLVGHRKTLAWSLVQHFWLPLLDESAKPHLGFVIRRRYGNHQALQQQAGARIRARDARQRLDDPEVGQRRVCDYTLR